MKKTPAILTIASLLLLTIPSSHAQARGGADKQAADGKQSKVIETPAPENSWEFKMSMPGWLAGLQGDVGVRNVSTHVDVDFTKIVPKLKAIASLSGEVRKGKFGFYADFLYMSVGDSASGNGRNLVTSTDFRIKQILSNIDLSYRVVESERGWLDVPVGVRINSITEELTAYTLFGGTRQASKTQTWCDPYLALRGRYNLSKAFYFTGKADVGGFDAGSKITWEVYAAFGCQLTRNIWTELGYQHLYTDYHHNDFLYKVSTSGPEITLGINF